MSFYRDRFAAMAHRGGFPEYENSMKAFERAYELGFRFFETDVHATKDRVLLAFHDETLDRATDGNGKIKDLTYDEISEVRIGGTEPIPLFADLVARFPDAYFNIDIKASGAIPPLAGLCESNPQAAARLCVTSFSPINLRDFRRCTFGQVTTSSSWPGIMATRLGIPDLGPSVAYQVPINFGKINVVNPKFIERAHRSGRMVHVWTINERHVMEQLIDLGVDGIVTDDPELLKDVLIQRGMWQE